jgi:hypothetical protein
MRIMLVISLSALALAAAACGADDKQLSDKQISQIEQRVEDDSHGQVRAVQCVQETDTILTCLATNQNVGPSYGERIALKVTLSGDEYIVNQQ